MKSIKYTAGFYCFNCHGSSFEIDLSSRVLCIGGGFISKKKKKGHINERLNAGSDSERQG